MQDVDAGYLAGILEGEASFLVYRNHFSSGYGRAGVEISSTDIEIVRWVSRILGGNVRRKANVGNGRKPQWVLRCKPKGCLDILPGIIPLMKASRIQRKAELVLDFLATCTGAPLSEETIQKRDVILREHNSL